MKYTIGISTAAATTIATSWAKSVITEARKPDHRVYASTPAPAISTPWMKDSGESTATSAPAALKFTIRLMHEPTMLDTAITIWLEVPWRACRISARVWASGASSRKRFPNG